MSTESPGLLATNFMTDALAADIALHPVSPDQVPAIDGAGNPQTGSVVLGHFGDHEIGVWEMTVGAMTDVEVDEVSIIITGSGSVERTIDGEQVTQRLQPGVVLQLRAGEETLWWVTETLRKVYLI